MKSRAIHFGFEISGLRGNSLEAPYIKPLKLQICVSSVENYIEDVCILDDSAHRKTCQEFTGKERVDWLRLIRLYETMEFVKWEIGRFVWVDVPILVHLEESLCLQLR